MLLVAVVFVVHMLMDDSLNTAEDVEKEFGIMPFTVIPEGDIEEISDEVEKRSVKRKRKEGRKSNGIYTEKPCDRPEYAETSVCGRGSTEPSARQCELSWKQSEKNHGDIQRSG